jgi:hypothetical protein
MLGKGGANKEYIAVGAAVPHQDGATEHDALGCLIDSKMLFAQIVFPNMFENFKRC